MKAGRAVGIDDGYFERGHDSMAPLVFTLMKGSIIEGFRFSWVEVDGTDVTRRIVEILLPLRDQVSVIFLYGTIFGGTNVVSLPELHGEIARPVIAVVDEPPEEEKVLLALRRWGKEKSLRRYRENPPLREVSTVRGTLWVSWVRIPEKEVVRIVEAYQIASKIPEPLRVSHLIGREVGRWI